MQKELVGVYPGSFDPVTNGHMDIIRRATRIVNRLVVSVAVNPAKQGLFTIEERLEIVRAEVETLNHQVAGRVEVRAFQGLLMHYVQSVGATAIVRGLRAVSDFDYEFQMTGMNARLDPEIETVFLMASEKHQFISSRFVKEIAALGGDIRSFVSPKVAELVVARYHERGEGRRVD